MNIKFNVIALFLLTICAILVYGNSLHSPFIWDDAYLITENHFIESSKYIFEIFKHQLYYSTAGASNFYRPLQTLFLMLDYTLWQKNPFGYHLTSIIFHILCAFLAFILIKYIFKDKVVAFLVALLFLVHPANSIVVNYISSRADSQVTLFILLSSFLFAKYDYENKNSVYLFGSLVSFVLALLSKELGMILPFLLLPIIAVSNKKTLSLKRTIPFFIILGIYILSRLTYLNFSGTGESVPPPFYTRILTAAEAIVRLISLLFVPLNVHIEKAIPYSKGLLQYSTSLSVIILIGMGIFTYWVRKRSKMVFFGMSWFFISILPMCNIIPINATMADHWLYLPCFGFFLVIIGGLKECIKRLDFKIQEYSRKLLIMLYTIIIVAFSILTIRQNETWRFPIKFYQLILKDNPKSFRANNELGIIYLTQNKYDTAILEFKKAIKTNPRFDQAYDNLGVTYDKMGNLEMAIKQHKQSLKLNPYNAKTYNNLGNAYNKLNKYDQAIEAYQNALRLNPDYKTVYHNIAIIYYKKGDFGSAKKYWETTVRIDPNFKEAYEGLKILQQMRKK